MSIARARHFSTECAKLMSSNARIVKCPNCGSPVPWTPESKWRPFCSQRCKTMDLGAWASERYRVKTSQAPDDSGDDDPDTALS